MRLNGRGVLTLEDARTWIEETGLCLFLPRRQFSAGVAPSFVEAIAGERNPQPPAKQIALAEELLVRLELDGVAVRLNLLGQPGEQPDFVVAAWVLPYVYALRGDRDWRRIPQLTGSRQVSQLAIQAYKLLETGDATIPQLKHTLGREVTEGAVLRAITELWQQLRIIPVIAAPGKTAQWQLLRHRFQKAIAEGASTSQVTAISVLASIYLQAVIAASMEEVEIFLSPLTARSKIREVLRGLVATRQVHTISFGHAPHFYVAGTLPEFSVAPTVYASSAMAASSYFSHARGFEEDHHEPTARPLATPAANFTPRVVAPAASVPPSPPAPAPIVNRIAAEAHTPRVPAVHKPAPAAKSNGARPHFSRPAAHSRDRKPAQSANGRHARRSSRDTRPTGRDARSSHDARSSRDARSSNGLRHAAAPRWTPSANGKTKQNGAHNGSGTHHANGNGHARPAARNGKATPQARDSRNHTTNGHNGNGHNGNGHKLNGKRPAKPSISVRAGSARKDVRSDSRRSESRRPDARRTESRRPESRRIDARAKRKPALTAGAKANNSKRYGFRAASKPETNEPGTKKRG
jgi:hypothetical protein